MVAFSITIMHIVTVRELRRSEPINSRLILILPPKMDLIMNNENLNWELDLINAIHNLFQRLKRQEEE